MKIIGYTYEADHHCVECTQKRWQVDTDATKYVRKPEPRKAACRMKSIQRYALATTTCAESGEVHPYMERCKDGLYVSHADHVRELAALRDDSERLDILEAHLMQHPQRTPEYSGRKYWRWMFGYKDASNRFGSLREAIDSLRAALQSGKEE